MIIIHVCVFYQVGTIQFLDKAALSQYMYFESLFLMSRIACTFKWKGTSLTITVSKVVKTKSDT